MTDGTDLWPLITNSQRGWSFCRCENYDRSLNPFGDDEEDGGGGGDVPSVVEGREDARPPRPQRKPRRHNPDSNPK